MDIEQIDEFEARNDTVAINVYMYAAETNTPRKCRTSMRNEDGYTEINLLLFDDHYMWISHLSRFLNSRVGGAHRSLIMCPSCELHFTTKLGLQKHAKYCRHKEGYSILPQIAMPRVGQERLRFTEYTKTQFVPVVIYADFESILPRCDDNNDAIPIAEAAHEVNINHHVPCGFGVKLVCIWMNRRRKTPWCIAVTAMAMTI